MTTNTTGPAELRRLASAFPEELPQLSARAGALIAQWEADRAELAEAERRLAVVREEAEKYKLGWLDLTQLLDDAAAAITGERARSLARQVELASLLELMRDDSPCRLDHHGCCQAHNWTGEPPCIQVRISAALSAQAAPAGETKESE